MSKVKEIITLIKNNKYSEFKKTVTSKLLRQSSRLLFRAVEYKRPRFIQYMLDNGAVTFRSRFPDSWPIVKAILDNKKECLNKLLSNTSHNSSLRALARYLLNKTNSPASNVSMVLNYLPNRFIGYYSVVDCLLKLDQSDLTANIASVTKNQILLNTLLFLGYRYNSKMVRKNAKESGALDRKALLYFFRIHINKNKSKKIKNNYHPALDNEEFITKLIQLIVKHDHKPALKGLIDEGINITKKFGSAVNIAYKKEKTGMVKLLIDHGADPRQATCNAL